MTTDTIADQGTLTTANVADPAVTNDNAAATTPETTAPAADPNTSRRQTIAAVFDALEDKTADDGEAAKPAEAKPTGSLPKVDPAENKPAPTIDPITGRTVEPIKPPASMPAPLREKWSNVDPQFQKFWVDRERDMARTMQDVSEDRKFAKELRNVISPYEDTLKQLGATAPAHIGDLLALSRGLYMGNPQQRAKIIVDLTNSFRPDAQTMVALFNGQQVSIPAVTAPAPQPSEDQIADQVLERRQQQEFVNRSQAVLTDIQNDPAYEFFPDVRGRMSKLVEAGLVEGATPEEVLKNAYTMAVSQDKTIQEVLAERARASAAPTANTTRGQAPRSVKPSLGTGRANSPASKPMSSREATLAAWDKLKV